MDQANNEDRLTPDLIKLGLVVVIGVFMSILDTTIVNVALETLGRELDAPLSSIQWITTGYLLALSLVIPVGGWVTDRFGARRLFLTSLALFTLGSALCGLAWDTGSLIFFRVLQGAGGAVVLPVGQTIIARAAGPARMGRMMSIVGIPALLGPVLGPVLGGLIVDSMSWRWIFLVNVPVGVVGVLLALRVIPADRPQPREHLDVPGLLLLSPALALLVYGLSEAGEQGAWGVAEVWVPMAVGLALGCGFVGWAVRVGDRAIVPITYFRYGSFTGSSIVTFAFGVSIFGAMLLLPLYYQQVRGASALEAGLLLAPQGIGACLAMPLSGLLTDRIGPRRIVLVGVAVMTLGTLTFTQLTATSPYWLLVLSLVVRGFGLGAAMMPAMAAGYRQLPMAAAARATTALNIFQRIGGSVGTALVSVILVRAVADRAPAAPPTPDQLAGAYGETFWWVVGLTAMGLLVSFLLPARPLRQAAPGDGPAGGSADAGAGAGSAAGGTGEKSAAAASRADG